MEPDNSQYTYDDMRILPHYDTRVVPIAPPSRSPWEGLKTSLCINAEWWPHITGLLTRLQYEDAWKHEDPEYIAQVVQWVTQIIDQINKRELCMGTNPLQDPCCCNQTNITNIEFFNSYYAQNNTQQSVINNAIDIDFILNLAIENPELLSEIGDSLITDERICTAAHIFLYVLHDLGQIDKDGYFDSTQAGQFLHFIYDVAKYIFIAGTILAQIFTLGQATVLLLGFAAFISEYGDDITVMAAIWLINDFTQEELDVFACKLFEAMASPTASYVDFQTIDFEEPTMNAIWNDIVNPELYAGWLTTVDQSTWNLDYTCCNECEVRYPGHEDIRIGKQLHSDTRFVITDDYAPTSVLKKTANVRFHFDEPRKITKVSVWVMGRRYSNTGLQLHIQSGNADYAMTDMVFEDGSAYNNSDMNQANVYFAPASQISPPQLPADYWDIEIQYGVCAACSTTQLEQFENAYGVMYAVTFCWEPA